LEKFGGCSEAVSRQSVELELEAQLSSPTQKRKVNKMIESENLINQTIREQIKTAVSYALTFATEPWLEVSRGKVCGNFYGPENKPGTNCPCGCGKLEEAYPIRETTRYIRREISKPKAIALIVKKEEKVVAFGWGYVETGKEFADEKYKKSDEKTRKSIAELVGANRVVFYLSEFGVVSEERNKEIGKQITQMVISEASKLNLPFLMRTSRSSFMARIARKLGMVPIMGSDPNDPDYPNDPITPIDPENSERILFYKE
jgi:hypothetical protein